MADITLRTGETGKGAPLTLEQVDQNFINLNNELGLKLYSSDFTGANILNRLTLVDVDDSGLNCTFLRSLEPSSALPSATDKSSVVIRDSSGNFSATQITANIIGTLEGNVHGDLTGNSAGIHTGSVIGNVQGNVVGNLSGDTTGIHTGAVHGNVEGDVTGTLFGPSNGLHTGNVIGNVQGNVTGTLTGNASTVTNGVYTNGSYSNPVWITSLAGSKVTSIPNSSLQNSKITVNGTDVSLGGSINVPMGIKAWVVFNGQDGTIISSYNVDAVLRTGAGRYTINITSGTFANGNFAVSGMASDNDHVVNWVSSTATQLAITTSDTHADGNNAFSNTQRVSVIMIA